MTEDIAIAMAQAAIAEIGVPCRIRPPQKGMSHQARGRLGGLTTASRYTPSEMAERLQAGKARAYLAQVDREALERGQGALSGEERQRRAALLLRAHMVRIGANANRTGRVSHGRNPRMPGEPK